MLNPLVNWDPPNETGNPQKLSEAFSYAEKAKKAYENAAENQLYLTNAMPLALIPMSAAAIGLGIHSVSGEAITALGLSGATIFGFGTWFSSKDRQRIYLEGAKKVGCAKTAVEPLNFDHGTFSQHLLNLNGSIQNTASALNTLKKELGLAQSVNANLSTQIDTEMTAAETLLQDSRLTLKVGLKLENHAYNAGQRLINAVDNIGADINKAVLETQPDISALSGIINGLSQYSSQITAVPEPKAAAPEKDKQEGLVVGQPDSDLEAALFNLREKMSELKRDQGLVAVTTNQVNAKTAFDALKQCGVDPNTLIQHISLDPSGSYSLAQCGTFRLAIKGGKAPFSVRFLGESATGLTVKPVETFGRDYQISASDQTPEGTYTLKAEDGARHEKSLTVTITKKQNGNCAGGAAAANDPNAPVASPGSDTDTSGTEEMRESGSS